jgi:phosphohistidine phosphatase
VRILLVRHAAAVKGSRPGLPDEARRLTKAGTRAFAEAARGLSRAMPRPALVLTSPLLRARQTAEIAVAAWHSRLPIVETPALAQPAPGPVLKLLARHKAKESAVLFGHEPGLSRLLAHLLGGRAADAFVLKKGAAALVETDIPVRRGKARLVWFLPPRLLRSLGAGR